MIDMTEIQYEYHGHEIVQVEGSDERYLLADFPAGKSRLDFIECVLPRQKKYPHHLDLHRAIV